MASHAQLLILKQKLIEEKRSIDQYAGRLLKRKMEIGEDPAIEQILQKAAEHAAKSSVAVEVALEHLNMRIG